MSRLRYPATHVRPSPVGAPLPRAHPVLPRLGRGRAGPHGRRVDRGRQLPAPRVGPCHRRAAAGHAGPCRRAGGPTNAGRDRGDLVPRRDRRRDGHVRRGALRRARCAGAAARGPAGGLERGPGDRPQPRARRGEHRGRLHGLGLGRRGARPPAPRARPARATRGRLGDDRLGGSRRAVRRRPRGRPGDHGGRRRAPSRAPCRRRGHGRDPCGAPGRGARARGVRVLAGGGRPADGHHARADR